MSHKYVLNREGHPMIFHCPTDQERRIARWIATGLKIVVCLAFGVVAGLIMAPWWYGWQ